MCMGYFRENTRRHHARYKGVEVIFAHKEDRPVTSKMVENFADAC